MSNLPEVWLRGPIDGVAAELQPAAHALLQTLEDVAAAVEGLSIDELWAKPGGAGSLGFHLMHLAGATDRLLTYARGERLNDRQKAALTAEQAPPALDQAGLLPPLRTTIDAALAQIKATPAATLADTRTVGRAALKTTVLGLIFHAAEHAQRHAGQVVTTAKIVRALRGQQ